MKQPNKSSKNGHGIATATTVNSTAESVTGRTQSLTAPDGNPKLPSVPSCTERFHFAKRHKILPQQQEAPITKMMKRNNAKKTTKVTTTTMTSTLAAQQSSSLMVSLLSDDLMIQVCEFLTEQDCHALMQTSRRFYNLLGSTSSSTSNGQYVWKRLMEQRWPYLASSSSQGTLSAQKLQQQGLPDMKTLLRLKAESPPTNVGGLVGQLKALDQDEEDGGNPKAIQFHGTVGAGNRCFRSDKPFVAPKRQDASALQDKKTKKRWWQRIRLRRKSRNNNKDDCCRWQPFVLPFQTAQGDYCLAPRLISYFEVAIREPTATKTPSSDQGSGSATARLWQAGRADCVAVGLSTHRFQLHRRMPGWDAYSFGYHGDDGSKFHTQGVGTKYGQRFGLNDIVGCGIDYQNKSIFYTLNGQFLGYAHKLDQEQVQRDWFPTVGVDSHAVCQFNFGKKPFAYDLQGMILQAKKVQG